MIDSNLLEKVIFNQIVSSSKGKNVSNYELGKLFKGYMDLTRCSYDDMVELFNISRATICEYIQLFKNNIKDKNSYYNRKAFNVYKTITDLKGYLSKHKDIPLNRNQKDDIKLLILQLSELL